MFRENFISVLFFVLCSFYSYSQKDSVKVETSYKMNSSNTIYNPLSPSKAAFYSAIFPGGGQIYNKKYWKVPIVWSALGTSTYFYLNNNSQYKRYRSAYKQRKNGLQDEFTLDDGTEIISLTGLERAQKTLRGNRDLSILSTVLIYVLQIVEASVNAHLLQFDASDNLTVNPKLFNDPIRIDVASLGLSLKYTF
ncbi:MAG: Uncharacterised protein [Flavobacterium sp. SCGC AAA160-P02]|nr:MAG: Uncharacterised protein [Flavobacterium sp. SCGC AAA160-P02]